MRALPIWLLILAAIVMAVPLAAQDSNASKPEPGHITGTVTDVNDDVLSGATVVVEGPALKQPRTVISNDNGSFDPEEVATEQVKIEEQQRVFGIFPNFYVVYDPDPAPLTTKLKFRLALKTSADPVTILGVAVLAGINQAADVPDYQQGWKGYGERFGAVAADGFSDIMIGGAILPSLLRQDPRYYYQGTGTNKSRALHALSSPFICTQFETRWPPRVGRSLPT